MVVNNKPPNRGFLLLTSFSCALVFLMTGQKKLGHNYQVVCVLSISNTFIQDTEGDILCRRFDVNKKDIFMKGPEYYDRMRFEAKAFVGEL